MVVRLPAQSGFTLIEMLIVTSVISILAGVAVPNLISSRVVANERAVVATMRTIVTAQAQAKTINAVDTDGDGQSEALAFAELAGNTPLRGTTERLVPPSLSANFGIVDSAGCVNTKGYRFAIFLPDAGGNGVAATPLNLATVVDADQAENYWTCIAWPQVRGSSGRVTFFVNQGGDVLMSKTATYSGSTSVPPAGAAMLGGSSTLITGSSLAINGIGADGNRWGPAQ